MIHLVHSLMCMVVTAICFMLVTEAVLFKNGMLALGFVWLGFMIWLVAWFASKEK